MKKAELAEYFAKIGAKGGKKSKRPLTKEEASRMAKRRWEKQAKGERERQARIKQFEAFQRNRITNLDPAKAFRWVTRHEEYTPTAKRDLRKILKALTKDSPDTVRANFYALKLKEISGCWLGDIIALLHRSPNDQ